MLPQHQGRAERRRILPGRRGAGAGHGASKPRDQPGVQPVGLGDAPRGGSEGPDLAGVCDADPETGRDQRHGERPGRGADRLDGAAAEAAPPQRPDQSRDPGAVVPDAQRPGGGLEAEVENGLADIDAGNGGSASR